MASDIKTVDLTLALPLRHLGNERKAIEDKLNGLVSHFVAEADGVLLKWTDLTIINDKGIIQDDQPYVFWKVSFTAHVFKPIEGRTVQGKVHKVQKHYIIAKAMSLFTVTVSIPENLLDNKTVQNIALDNDIYFKMKSCSGDVYRGELDEECLKLTKNSINSSKEVYDYAKDFEY